MKSENRLMLEDLPDNTKMAVSNGRFVEKTVFRDINGSKMTVLSVCNKELTYTILPERGMDIGAIFSGDDKVSWDRDLTFLLHPRNVNLNGNQGTGWIQGFYPAVASIGPELFGTPGEGFTLHGTGSYSTAAHESVFIRWDEQGITVEGIIPVKGYGDTPLFEKRIKIISKMALSAIFREEATRNLSHETLILDDGLHIQLCGSFLAEGGRYVLPVRTRELLLRDSAPPEADPLKISSVHEGCQPLRCYQYVPEPVTGLDDIGDVADYLPYIDGKFDLTAEMIVNAKGDTATYVVRPLDCFPRSLIAKEVAENAMFSFEPCRTRPNRMSQKITDGEAFFLEPGQVSTTQCLMGILKDQESILQLQSVITKAAT